MPSVLVVNENHLQRTPDGKCWSKGIVDYSVFARPLGTFDKVFVAIRVEDVDIKDSDYIHICTGDGVEILPLPDYKGAFGYIKVLCKFRKLMKKYCKMVDCAIVRTPNAISFQCLKFIKKRMPYAIEVSGDPWEHMAPGEYKSKFRPLIRCMWTNGLRRVCLSANGVSYVTKDALQRRYPCRAILERDSDNYFTTYYSTVSLNTQLKYEAKEYTQKKSFKLIHISNAFTTYGKGQMECIEAVSLLVKSGIDVSIDFVGEGPLKEEFIRYSEKYGVPDRVNFVGRLNSKEKVWDALRNADIFVFPTHSEGLPRVVIESMYVGTPVVATNVGGIPELLESECIFDVGDVNKIYEILSNLFGNPSQLNELSETGIKKSLEYTEDVLQARRIEFYKKLKHLCV
jgi:glycosyltransferase involved in cell wall biosynthesis